MKQFKFQHKEEAAEDSDLGRQAQGRTHHIHHTHRTHPTPDADVAVTDAASLSTMLVDVVDFIGE